MPFPFDGQLRTNENIGSMYNMIINIFTYANNIKGASSKLINRAKTEGGQYGDTKLYVSTDAVRSKPFGGDDSAASLLELERPQNPEVQAIHIDVFRQIAITIDEFLSKRAWGDEAAFTKFKDVMLGWIMNTKKIYESTTYNVFIGTTKSTSPKQNVAITVNAATEAQDVARAIADLIDELCEVSRDFNDYNNIREYDEDEIEVIFNKDWYNKIKYLDLPTIFHNEALIAKFDKDRLNARYFGNVLESGGTSNGTQRSMIEVDYNVVKQNDPDYDKNLHIFPGFIIPDGQTYGAKEAYTEDPDVICKICFKLPPFLTGIEVGTEFNNPKSLTQTHYFTWGHNTLEYLKDGPFITVKKAGK